MHMLVDCMDMMKPYWCLGWIRVGITVFILVPRALLIIFVFVLSNNG